MNRYIRSWMSCLLNWMKPPFMIQSLSLSLIHIYLIVLDIMLPKIDGYGVCELIRKQSDVPIIMLTALSGEEDQIKGLDLQVDDLSLIHIYRLCVLLQGAFEGRGWREVMDCPVN